MSLAVLDSTKSLEILLATAVTTAATYTVVYADHSATAFTEGSFQGVITNTNNTATTVAAAPSAGTQRGIKSLTIFNNDASASITVTLRYNVSSSYYPIDKQSVAAEGKYSFVSSGVQGPPGTQGPPGIAQANPLYFIYLQNEYSGGFDFSF